MLSSKNEYYLCWFSKKLWLITTASIENKTSVGKIKSDANKNIYDHFIDQENSLFVTKIDRSNQDLQTHFKNLWGELKESDIRLYRLTKRTLRSFLTEKFSARIADKFTAPLDMIIPFDYNEFCYTFNKLVNLERTTLFKIAFNIYDWDEDK